MHHMQVEEKKRVWGTVVNAVTKVWVRKACNREV